MKRTEIVPDDRAFVVHVETSKPTATEDWQKIFDELDHAMDEIEAKVTEDDGTLSFHYCLIRLHVESFDTELFFCTGGLEHSFTSYNPWEGYSPDFWYSAITEPASRQRVERWVSRYAKTLKCAAETRRSTASLWEDSSTQFGEPLICLLAFIDVTFVARYIEFIELWDLGHQAWIWPAIAGVLKRHGVRPETLKLAEIYAYVNR